ncbi:hypothetical protein [Loigolactobacillus bifermentans]|jgi:hypothetical protein|uniref:Uncharacterized protein n=2 Tax=Loigolactobacillus bifermentans TaxID=1607 RepID=A0A0R1H2Q5_9LACO|nr:hypothetical protein [Loigolactobacillus bifermentans]KRK40281.1 hypothetical protein FC07_GL001143 [Loigolactobacillus bifermentans DSM 20003]QGG61752.1 hypothetical protein LB003_15460 [Loigolactobacillus bifermentans]
MNIDNFTLDAAGAAIVSSMKRDLADGKVIIKTLFSNGFVWIYTQLPDGRFERMDFSHKLVKTAAGYAPKLSQPKADFYDYFDD